MKTANRTKNNEIEFNDTKINNRFRFLQQKPNIHKTAWVAPSAEIIGDVELGKYSCVLYGAVLRGDIQSIKIGKYSNIQDLSVVHLAEDFGVEIGDYVTIGHKAIIHACKIEDEVLVGMGATIMDGAVVGKRSIIGAGALVPQGMKIPPGSLVLGIPAKIKKTLSEQEQDSIKPWAIRYSEFTYFQHNNN